MSEIQIADIEKDLDKLWAMQGSNRVRASLFNLVVYSQDPNRTRFLQEILKSIVEKFPCRIIFIKCDQNSASDFLTVKVSDELTKAGNKAVICDHIVIETSLQQLQRVYFIILPHLLPDLPIYLLWGHDPMAEKVIFPRLHPYASRLIFDSDFIVDPTQFSRKILALMKEYPHLDVIDINWVRCHDWRNVMRQVFCTEKAISDLSKNKGIQIRYNSKNTEIFEHPELQSLYLANWLEGQLKWQEVAIKQAEHEFLLKFKKDDNEFIVRIIPQEYPQFAPGTIVEVEITCPNDLTYLLTPVPNAAKAVVHISSPETCELPYTLPMTSFKKGFSCVTELLFDHTSNHYKNMLQTFTTV